MYELDELIEIVVDAGWMMKIEFDCSVDISYWTSIFYLGQRNEGYHLQHFPSCYMSEDVSLMPP